MLKEIIVIFIVFSVSYWIGYFAKQTESDLRPICFVAFLNSNAQYEHTEISSYFGQYDKPFSNIDDSLITLQRKDGTNMFFFISKDKLLEEANGRKIILVMNTAKYSKRNNKPYMEKVFDNGTYIIVDETTFEV